MKTLSAARIGFCISAVVMGTHPADAETRILVPGGPLHGVNGLSIGPDGALYAASFLGQTISKIDLKTGRVEIVVTGPAGDSDDVAVRADGALAWTAAAGEVRGKLPGGEVRVFAAKVPGVNPVTWAPDGRLVFGQMGQADTIWSVDVAKSDPPRVVKKDAGHVNGFAFGKDGRLYAPLWQKDSIIAIDPKTGATQTVVSGIGMPSAVKVNAKGDLISSDWMTGEIRRTDAKSGKSLVIATVAPPVDNLAVAKDGTVYVSHPADSSIEAITPGKDANRMIVPGNFAVPAGMTTIPVAGRTMLLVADPLTYRTVDPLTGAMPREGWVQDLGMSTDIAANTRFVVTSHQSRGLVQKFARNGTSIFGELVESYPVSKATGVAVLINGDVIAASFDKGELLRLKDNAATPIVTGLGGPMNVLRVSEHEVLVSEATAGVVSRIDLTSGTRTVVVRDLAMPQGIALLRDGRLAVAEKRKQRVIVIDMTGQMLPVVVAENLPFATGILRALPEVGLSVGLALADGALYVTCAGDNSIRTITLP